MVAGRFVSVPVVLFILIQFIGFSSVRASVAITCLPVSSSGNSVNCSSNKGYGRLNGIVNETLKKEDYSIDCQIIGDDQLINFEWIFVGEPPYKIALECDADTCSRLNGTDSQCSASDIPALNHPEPNEYEKRYNIGLGNVTYICGENPGFNVTFTGMRLLSKDLEGLLKGSGGSMQGCINESKIPPDADKKLIGKAAIGNCRQMYNELGDKVCSRCCADHFWSVTYQECRECSECITNDEPNVWTSCKHIKPCISVPVSPVEPGSLQAPKGLKVVHRASYSVTLQWDPLKSATVTEYVVVVLKSDEVVKEVSTRSTAAVLKVTPLLADTDYTAQVYAKNKAGNGSKSEPLHFHTMGTAPRHVPAGIDISQDGPDVTISWDTVVGMAIGDEDPIKGVKVEYWPESAVDNVTILLSNTTSVQFTLTKYGKYEIRTYSYNAIGNGAYQTDTITYSEGNLYPGWVVLISVIMYCLGKTGLVILAMYMQRRQEISAGMLVPTDDE